MRIFFLFAALAAMAGAILALRSFGGGGLDKEGESVMEAMSASSGGDAPIIGLWAIPDDDNKNIIQAAALVYFNGGKYYCRMIATFASDGRTVKDSIKNPVEKAKGIKSGAYLCGLDFIYGLSLKSGDRYHGKVIDPDSGSIYDCEVWFDGKSNRLVVRGELFGIGVNQYWRACNPSLLGFKVDPSKFVPNR